jgi:transposase-like protein
MTSILSEPEVFKVDRRGRVHVSAERREALLDEWERSGTSLPEFARLVGVKYATLAGWRAKRQRQRMAAPPPAVRRELAAPAVQLFEALVEAPSSASGGGALVVELPGGGRARVSAPEQVPWTAQLLRLLTPTGGRPC